MQIDTLVIRVYGSRSGACTIPLPHSGSSPDAVAPAADTSCGQPVTDVFTPGTGGGVPVASGASVGIGCVVGAVGSASTPSSAEQHRLARAGRQLAGAVRQGGSALLGDAGRHQFASGSGALPLERGRYRVVVGGGEAHPEGVSSGRRQCGGGGGAGCVRAAVGGATDDRDAARRRGLGGTHATADEHADTDRVRHPHLHDYGAGHGAVDGR
eukprot:ctg_597.g292